MRTSSHCRVPRRRNSVASVDDSRKRQARWPRWSDFAYDGHTIRYCVFGAGPPIAVVKPHRNPPVYDVSWLLATTHTVVQIEPLGFANSDRPVLHRDPGVARQVLDVLDHEQIDDFVVWGHSLGGAMATMVAQASPRVTAMIVNGYSPLDAPTESMLRRMDQEGSPRGGGDAAFWRSYRSFDWSAELELMRCRKLVHVGAEDRARMRGPRGIDRTRDSLELRGVTVRVFAGLDHITCAAEPALSARVLPEVLAWLDDQPPPAT